MFLFRKIAGILRGKATPFQLAMACILGGMIGFIPGFVQAPGLLVFLLLVLAVLNANLAVAAVVGGLAYLVSLLATPLSFEVGRFLLDGPTSGLFRWAINAPVLALFGFQYYVTTGGMVVGLVFGVLAGAGLVSVVLGFRRKMSGLEEGSERYQRYTSKGWVKFLSWVLLGSGKGKKTYAELSRRKVGLPVRLSGVVLVLLLAGLVFIAQSFFSEQIVTALLTRGLERANNATVDVGRADLDLKTGKLVVHDLAMADAGKAGANGRIDVDLLRVARIDADVSGADLLRARMTVDRAVLAGATNGEKRRIPGRIIRPPAPPPPSPAPNPDEKTLDDYLAEAKTWKERLEQARKWLDWLESRRPDAAPGPDGRKPETIKERLEREIREKGYRRVTASHLVEGAPTLLIRDAVVEDMTTTEDPGQKYRVRAQNISTQPWLVEQAPTITVKTGGGELDAEVVLSAAAKVAGPSTLRIERKNLDADRLMSRLAGSVKVNGQPPVQGGTVDLKLSGAIGGGPDRWIEFPLVATLHNSTVMLPEAGATKLETLSLPFGLRGPMSNPVVSFDDDRLADALVAAGKAELANRVRGEAQKAVDKATDKLEEEAGDLLKDKLPGALADPLKGLIPGGKPKK